GRGEAKINVAAEATNGKTEVRRQAFCTISFSYKPEMIQRVAKAFNHAPKLCRAQSGLPTSQRVRATPCCRASLKMCVSQEGLTPTQEERATRLPHFATAPYCRSADRRNLR